MLCLGALWARQELGVCMDELGCILEILKLACVMCVCVCACVCTSRGMLYVLLEGGACKITIALYFSPC